MSLRIQCVCVDTADPSGLANFWESALGWRRTYEQDDEVVLEPPVGSPEDGIVPDLLFLRVPEDKAAKNRDPTLTRNQPVLGESATAVAVDPSAG